MLLRLVSVVDGFVFAVHVLMELFSSAATTWPRTAVILVFGITGMPPPRSRDEQIRQLKDCGYQ